MTSKYLTKGSMATSIKRLLFWTVIDESLLSKPASDSHLIGLNHHASARHRYLRHNHHASCDPRRSQRASGI
jgi:hypothetical protein